MAKLPIIKAVGRSKYEKIFITRTEYGKWTADPGVWMDNKGRAYAKCYCNLCGNISFVACHHLVIGNSTQCKNCNNSATTRGHSLNPNWQGVGEISKTYLSHISKSAAQCQTSYTITATYANDLLVSSNNTCAISGEPISFTAGTAELVPINQTTGYTQNNVMWVHKNVAPAIRKTKHANEFIDMCVKIAQKHTKEK